MVIASTTSKVEKTRREVRSHYEIAKHSHHLQQPHQGSDNEVNTRRIDLATEGLAEYVHRQLTDLCKPSLENALTIVNYVLTQKTEVNIADTYRLNIISTLIVLSKFLNHKPFRDMTEEDIVLYLDSLRKLEASDPLHKWIGTYNEKRQRLVKFFRWLYNPDKMDSDRQTPEFMKHIPDLKRKEQSIYKPGDLWSKEDDLLFLRYCPSKRDKCYHAVSRDASSRPHELLGMKIREIYFKVTGDNKQYAEVHINGKTGTRSIPLFDSIPYLKDWINAHPQPGNPNALLIPSLSHRAFGRKMKSVTIGGIYRSYRTRFFPKLLNDPNISSGDKNKISELLKKPWNPYIRRHSALTEKSTILREHTLRQHAGWSTRSNMHMKYLHYFGNESSESLLEAYGIVTRDQMQSEALKYKQCPNCSEPNKPDSKFCAKCRMVLTYDAYNETMEENQNKDKELQSVKERMANIETILVAIQPLLQQVKPEMLSKLQIVQKN
jgi:hypothetical protein